MEKTLQYYLDHPDETPDDPAVLATLAEQMAAPPAEEVSAPATKDVKKEEEPAPSSEPAEEPKQVEEEGAIATPSGKGTIPYAVLKGEREKRQAAEAAVADLSERLKGIEQQMAQGSTNAAEAAIADLPAEELEALRIDFPVFGKVIDSLLNKIESLTGEISGIKQIDEERQAATQRQQAATVQELIDNDPVLSHLQRNDPELFAKAVDIDRTLIGDPRFPDMASRFAKVSETVESLFGPFDGVSRPKSAPSIKPIDKAVARAAVTEQIANRKATPTSLSDIPSGDAQETDELDDLENLSPTEIGARMLKMSEAQRTAFLNRF